VLILIRASVICVGALTGRC